MDVKTFSTVESMGAAAAEAGGQAIRDAIAANGEANIILATGTSQFATLERLRSLPGIDWSKVTAFHLDEYVGMASDHPASFVGYLQERFVKHVPSLRRFVFLDGTADPSTECRRVSDLILGCTIDVAFIGIGENGHVAFNDPPADFETDAPYLVVDLDDACRRQQLGEGWFPTFDDVPKQALTMSVKRIMASRKLVVTVPDERKAKAVACAVKGPVTPDCPASILQRHADCTLFLDEPAASLIGSLKSGGRLR